MLYPSARGPVVNGCAKPSYVYWLDGVPSNVDVPPIWRRVSRYTVLTSSLALTTGQSVSAAASAPPVDCTGFDAGTA